VEEAKDVPFPGAQGKLISEQRAIRGSTKPSATLSPQASGVGPGGPMLETDRYSNFRLISDKGGSGIVVQALDNDILREVAIKIFHVDDDGSEIDRYAEEARINGQLEHPNIVPVYELGTDLHGRRFLCMKLVNGATLDEALNRLGVSRLAPTHLADLLQVFVKVCDAVSYAHSRGVLHRDLKPTNVMISDFGQVYVLDWGIARLRPPAIGGGGPHRVRVSAGPSEQSERDERGSLVGTACYMAPEQLQGLHDRLDERTDVFALGATLYQILTGQPPLTAEIARAIWMRKPPPPIVRPESLVPDGAVPVELSHIALRALSYDPEERYKSVAELKHAIEWFQRGAWDMPRERFTAGAVVIVEGEPGEAAYVILEGECVAYHVENGVEVALRTMGVGDVFGETAVFSERPRTASVKAVTDVLLLVVTRDVLSRALGLNSWMGAFVKTLAERFREADVKLRGVAKTV
jgi:serine/threonine-protein kinase